MDKKYFLPTAFFEKRLAKKNWKKNGLLAIACISITAIAAFLLVGFVASQKPLVVEGIAIDSGQEDAAQLFKSFSQRSVFIVSPQMHETAQAVDHLMFNGAALFLQVFEGNDRKAIHVIRVYDDSGNFLYCLSNFGDVNRSETLEKEECLEYLSAENGALVMIEFPDASRQMPLIEISEGKIIVKPKANEGVGKTCFLALRIMFKNSQEIIDKANALLGKLSK